MFLKRAVAFISMLFTNFAILLLKIYRYIISPMLPASCRFYPTCSSYSIEAYRIHGPIKGSFLTLHRILRCNPWGNGGFDPVPAEFRFFK